MQSLNLPEYLVKTRIIDGQQQIFDEIRRKYVALIPEEWVRQHFINYLINDRGFPKGLIAVEHPLTINKVNHRADIIAFASDGKPLVVVECKAPEVAINQSVVQQVSRYNILLKAPILILTNGLVHYCVRINFENSSTSPLDSIPFYKDLL
ncbi:MAG: type I restriction enzyme HsdR N-terminal domain-containing protein [Bacteroidales bacterium]|nr:MAG: type I restriction enzyme HsdR N-terminal domain-containing protein [Bacteroidales bacterium]